MVPSPREHAFLGRFECHLACRPAAVAVTCRWQATHLDALSTLDKSSFVAGVEPWTELN